MRAHTDPAADTASEVQPADPSTASPACNAAMPIRSRLMIAVSDLTAHPGNVREDLNLTDEFLASIASEGVRIPLLIATSPDGGWRVIEGHRRLAAAAKAGLAEVPCDIDPGRADDEAGQYVDMLLANSDSYRANYTVLEEAAALFAAHEAGASRTRLRKATGRTQAQVKSALAAGGLSAATRAKAAVLNREMTLDDLALLAEFDGDDEATDRLLASLDYGYGLEHTAERIRQDRAEAAEHARLRESLEAAGIPVNDRLPDGAAWLTSLTHDGEELTTEAHATCPGHGVTFASWNLLQPSYYCSSPAEQGHASRFLASGPAVGAASSRDAGPGSTASPQPDPAHDASRRLVIAGNKAWQASAEVRHRWLTASLFPRKSLPREAQAFLARQLLAMPDPLRAGLAAAARTALFSKLTGGDATGWEQTCGTATNARLTIIALAPIITAYEHAMTDGEGRSTWRTDRYSPCPRRDAGSYLTFLAAIGYQLSAIEQAVADGIPWTGDTIPDNILSGHNQTDETAEAGHAIDSDDQVPASESDSDHAGDSVGVAT